MRSRLHLGESCGGSLMGIEVARLTGCILVSASLTRLRVGAEKIFRGPKSAVRDHKKTSPVESGYEGYFRVHARGMTGMVGWFAQLPLPSVKGSSRGLEGYPRSPESLVARINEVYSINESGNITVRLGSSSGTLCRFSDSIHGW